MVFKHPTSERTSQKVLYDELVREYAAHGHSYARYLQEGKPPQHWQVDGPLGMIDIGGIPQAPPMPAPPMTASPVMQQQVAQPHPAMPAPQTTTEQAAPVALADQLVGSGQPPVWQQVAGVPNPADTADFIFRRTGHQPADVEVVAPAAPITPVPASVDNGLVATQPMTAVTPPPRRLLGEGPAMQAGWAAQAAPSLNRAEPHTPLPSAPMNMGTPVPPTGIQSPMGYDTPPWSSVTAQD